MTMVPIGPTSMGSTTTVPPASRMRATVAAASSVAKYVVQPGESPGFISGPRPAAYSPLRVALRYPPYSGSPPSNSQPNRRP
jgi:hypothetical protein